MEEKEEEAGFVLPLQRIRQKTEKGGKGDESIAAGGEEKHAICLAAASLQTRWQMQRLC